MTAKTKAAGPATKALKVIALREGFRRGGHAFGAAPTVLPLAELTADQADAIRAETTMLVVEEVDVPAPGKG